MPAFVIGMYQFPQCFSVMRYVARKQTNVWRRDEIFFRVYLSQRINEFTDIPYMLDYFRHQNHVILPRQHIIKIMVIGGWTIFLQLVQSINVDIESNNVGTPLG